MPYETVFRCSRSEREALRVDHEFDNYIDAYRRLEAVRDTALPVCHVDEVPDPLLAGPLDEHDVRPQHYLGEPDRNVVL